MSISRSQAAGTRHQWDKRHHYESEYTNADEAEWSAVLRGSAHVSHGTQDEMMSEFALEDSETPGATYMSRESADEALQGAVLEVVAERMKLLGIDGYPFRLEKNSLVLSAADDHPYLALLAICNLTSLSAKPFNQAPVGFEYLSLLAARSYLGPNAKGWRFGWPRANKSDLLIKDAAATLKLRAGSHPNEWDWNPSPSLPESPTTKSLKDTGMDIVVWVPWADLGPAQLQLVGQCACGDDWKFKTLELHLPRLKQWMRVPEPPPVRALFTPRHTPLPTISYEAPQAGLMFDRIRMVKLLMSDARIARAAKRFTRKIVTIARPKEPAASPTPLAAP
ncbi:MAG: hypothetical protein PHH58_14455 [Rhodoferax sp.]|nr:hypothetical protein [Rhodoferax sp.]